MYISVDHGNKQIKLGRSGKIFISGLCESDVRPPIGEDILKYKGKYYTISDDRIPFMRDKSIDDRFFILTLFAVAFDIEDSGLYENNIIPVHLLCGLPPAHYGKQYERFEEYFKRGVVEFEFKDRMFKIDINDVTAFPQAFAAAMSTYNNISSLPKVMVIDIGGFTVDYLMLKNGQPNLSICDSLENGIIVLYNQIISKVNSELNVLLNEFDIDNILKDISIGVSEDVKRIVFDMANVFVLGLFDKLRERSIDLVGSGKVLFVGGGSILLRKQIEASGKVASPMFVDNISANAKGYELLYVTTKEI